MTQPKAEKLSVFIDADVLIAGSASTTDASHLILQLSELGLIEGISSEQVRQEVERNLTIKLPAAIPAFHLLAESALRWVNDPLPRDVARYKGEADPKDLPVFVAGLKAGCHTLVTFNVRDYRPTSTEIRIETPGDFLNRLRRHMSQLGS
ncbi:MAG: PIN domain-containing protein [Actinomycetota bacterium]|nr:PIN domain-containing protein [Actinomycetota bacterium]